MTGISMGLIKFSIVLKIKWNMKQNKEKRNEMKWNQHGRRHPAMDIKSMFSVCTNFHQMNSKWNFSYYLINVMDFNNADICNKRLPWLSSGFVYILFGWLLVESHEMRSNCTKHNRKKWKSCGKIQKSKYYTSSKDDDDDNIKPKSWKIRYIILTSNRIIKVTFGPKKFVN